MKLLLPYVAGATIVLVSLVVLIFVFRSRLRALLAAIDTEGSPREGVVRMCLLFALALLVFFTCVEAIAVAGFAAGISLGSGTVLVAALISIATTHSAARSMVGTGRSNTVAVFVVSAAVLCVAASMWVAGLFFDISWDGNWYHQQAVVAISEGWNPLRDPEGASVKIGTWRPDRRPDSIWDFAVTHYSKGGWFRQAALYRLAGRLEQAKATNVAMLLVSLAVWLALALRTLPRRRSWLLGAIVLLNPVILIQVFTFKNDGQLGSLFTTAIALGCLVAAGSGGWPVALALLCSLLMLATVKFTGLAYALILAAGFAGVVLVRNGVRRSLRPVAAASFGLLIAIVLVGFNPYVQNTIDHGFPLHPLMGTEGFDETSPHWPTASWPTNFDGTTSMERLVISLFSRSADESFLEAGGDVARLKIPFTVSASEIRPYMGVDTRVAGFGPLFSGALVLALVMTFLLCVENGRRRDARLGWALLAVALLVVTVVANPESWWARFAPQMWLIPVLIAGASLLGERSRVRLGLAWALVATLALNTLFVGTVNFANLVNGKHEISSALDRVEEIDGPVILQQGDYEMTFVKLRERGIPFELLPVGSTPPAGGITIPYTTATVYPKRD